MIMSIELYKFHKLQVFSFVYRTHFGTFKKTKLVLIQIIYYLQIIEMDNPFSLRGVSDAALKKVNFRLVFNLLLQG